MSSSIRCISATTATVVDVVFLLFILLLLLSLSFPSISKNNIARNKRGPKTKPIFFVCSLDMDTEINILNV